MNIIKIHFDLSIVSLFLEAILIRSIKIFLKIAKTIDPGNEPQSWK